MLYDKLDYVLAIAEEQNLTRAAKKLYISQPTLTMYLNRLEESLGVQLFERRKPPVLLTAAGKYYVEKMKAIAESEQILRSEIRSVANPAETFRIGIGRVRGHYWLPGLLHTFSVMHPNINLHITQGAERLMQKMLVNRSLDVGIGAFHEMLESEIPLFTEELSLEKMLLVSHRKFQLVPTREQAANSPANPYLLDAAQLRTLPFILPPAGSGIFQDIQKLMSIYNIHPSHTIVIDSLSTGLLLVEQGLGVQLISAGVLDAIPTEERRSMLDYCVLPEFPESRTCFVTWREDTEKQELIRDAIRILKEDVLPKQKYTEVL